MFIKGLQPSTWLQWWKGTQTFHNCNQRLTFYLYLFTESLSYLNHHVAAREKVWSEKKLKQRENQIQGSSILNVIGYHKGEMISDTGHGIFWDVF